MMDRRAVGGLIAVVLALYAVFAGTSSGGREPAELVLAQPRSPVPTVEELTRATTAVHEQTAEVQQLLRQAEEDSQRLRELVAQLGRVEHIGSSTTAGAASALAAAAAGAGVGSQPRAVASVEPGAGTASTAPAVVAPVPGTVSRKACPAGCTRYGNCNELSGECSCPFTRQGPACAVPTMPACHTGLGAAEGEEEGVINLSWLASESFWNDMRDVRNDPSDPRRSDPPYRWVGPVTCRCVEQAVARLSLLHSPQPPPWPRQIGHTELAMQRVACVAGPHADVAALWGSGAAELVWSYVPVTVWLKPFPAHSPMLLPTALVSERDFTTLGRDRNLMFIRPDHLARAAAAAAAAVANATVRRTTRRLSSMLPAVGRPRVLPLASCASSCSHAGWCGEWAGTWGRSERDNARCRCLKHAHRESESLRRACRGGRGGSRCRGWRGPQFEVDCTPRRRKWKAGMERAQWARFGRRPEKLDEERDRWGADMWRAAVSPTPRAKLCPNECLGRGICAYGFCHCRPGHWGLDCGFSAARVAELRAAAPRRPRIHVYETPVSLRRGCGPWRLPEELSDLVLRSEHAEPDPGRADLYWFYGSPNGDVVLPTLMWAKRSHPHWNASVAEGVPRHVFAVAHEEGWAEVWNLLGRWLGGHGDHSNAGRGWDDVHPASFTRQVAALQLDGNSDYMLAGTPRRGVTWRAPCRVCFQPGKDVMIPGFPGITDYPDDTPRPQLYNIGSRATSISECDRLKEMGTYLPDGRTLAPRTNRPRLFFSGAVQTKTHGPGLYEPSRVVLYECWKNRSAAHDFEIVQTESVLVSVSSWEVERPLDPMAHTRQASFCVVPEGKIGSYGHRAVSALMLGCVPVFTKERFSFAFFHQAINWSSIALHVPPDQLPRLPQILASVDAEAMRRAASEVRRRLLWTSIYGSCHLAEKEGGSADAFDTLMQVLRSPRSHFKPSAEHHAPRAPEMLDELFPWLRARGGEECTKGFQCFDQWRRSCAQQL